MPLSPPKPLPEKPSTGPAAARAAAQDAQIAELVEQNQTLDYTLSTLRDQLREEVVRGKNAVNQIRERWKAERQEWRDGCDSLQERHRLAHLQTRVALEHERGYRIEDRAALITERAASLLYEYKITLFQKKETELAGQVAALEEELEAQREEMVAKSTRHEAEVAQLAFRLADAEARRYQDAEQYGLVFQQKEVLDTELVALRASSISSAKQIDRLDLQIETLRTQISTLETRNKELQHQVEKWQSLEGKGEKEAQSHRTRRIELEVRVKELETNLKESRAMTKKIAKLESSLLETQELAEKRQRDVSEAQAEAVRAQKHAVKLEQLVEKLQAQLDDERNQKIQSRNCSHPPKKVGPRSTSVVLEEPEQSSNTRSKPRSRSRQPAPTRVVKTHGQGTIVDDFGATFERPKQDDDVVSTQAGDDDVVGTEVPPPTKKRDRLQERDSDVEEVPPVVTRKPTSKPPSRTGKAKETDVEDEGKEERNKWSRKPASTASVQNRSEMDNEEEQPAKKKKRKLTVIGGSSVFGGPAGFTWSQDDGGNLGIPSVLSPVKEGEPVPPRSTSASGWKIR